MLILGLVLGCSRNYASFFREHKPLRSYANPTYLAYSLGKYLASVSAPERSQSSHWAWMPIFRILTRIAS